MFATPKFIIYSAILTISTIAVGARGQVNGISDEAAEFRELMWEDLMSPADLAAILNAPMLSHDSFGWEDQLGGDPADDAYKNALQSFDVNPEVLNEPIMIPGFIVPTAYDDDRKITEFFFGALLRSLYPSSAATAQSDYLCEVSGRCFY